MLEDTLNGLSQHDYGESRLISCYRSLARSPSPGLFFPSHSSFKTTRTGEILVEPLVVLSSPGVVTNRAHLRQLSELGPRRIVNRGRTGTTEPSTRGWIGGRGQ